MNKTESSSRLYGLDIARALAILGMLVVNYTIVMGATERGPSWLVWANHLLSGKAAALFIIIAGIGVSLMSARALDSDDPGQKKITRSTLLKRSLFLFIVGLAYIPIWPADILHYYGVYLTIGAFLLFAPSKRLWWTTISPLFVFYIMLFTMDYEVGWNWKDLSYEGFWDPEGFFRNLLFNGFHPVFPWIGFLMIGMWVGRQNIRDRRVRARLMKWSLLTAISFQLMSTILSRIIRSDSEFIWLVSTEPMPPGIFYMGVAGGLGVAITMLCLNYAEYKPDSFGVNFLVPLGQLALTHYVGHVVIGMVLLEIFGLIQGQMLAFSIACALFYGIFAVVFSFFWRKKFRKGPLEAIMRKVAG